MTASVSAPGISSATSAVAGEPAPRPGGTQPWTCADALGGAVQALVQLGGGAPPGVAVLVQNAAARFSPPTIPRRPGL